MIRTELQPRLSFLGRPSVLRASFSVPLLCAASASAEAFPGPPSQPGIPNSLLQTEPTPSSRPPRLASPEAQHRLVTGGPGEGHAGWARARAHTKLGQTPRAAQKFTTERQLLSSAQRALPARKQISVFGERRRRSGTEWNWPTAVELAGSNHAAMRPGTAVVVHLHPDTDRLG